MCKFPYIFGRSQPGYKKTVQPVLLEKIFGADVNKGLILARKSLF
jgi:hypothetical protein